MSFLYSHAYIYFKNRFDTFTKNDLLGLANVLSFTWGIKLERKDKRSKKSLFKWFDNKWDTLYPLIENFIVISTNDGNFL